MNNRIKLLIAAVVLTLGTRAASVETDRPWYLAGEAMRLNVAADDALIAYAELCDTYGLAAGVVINLDGGRGTATVELPTDLHSGYYMLSVYTRQSANVLRQLVAVINPLRRSEDDDIEWVADDSSAECRVECVEFAAATPSSDPLGTAAANSKLSTLNSQLNNIPETEGHIVRARVRNVYDGKTYRGSQIRPSLSIVGKQIHYFEGKMVNDTTAVFFTYGLHGKQPLVLSAATYTGVSLPVEIISPFAALLPKSLPRLVFHYRRSEVEARSLDMQRHQIAIAPAKHELQLGEYEDAEAEDGVPLDYDNSVFGKKPDLSYNLDEYRQFLTIREVLTEYVSLVRRVKINGVPQLLVRKENQPYVDSWPAMVFIDGMPVIDVDRLLNYDARRIHYINIYSGQYTFGNGIYRGILSFVSRSGRLTNYPTEPNTQYLVYGFPE